MFYDALLQNKSEKSYKCCLNCYYVFVFCSVFFVHVP